MTDLHTHLATTDSHNTAHRLYRYMALLQALEPAQQTWLQQTCQAAGVTL